MEKKTIQLNEILGVYGVPDPKIVGKLPKGGQQLSFIGHADVTKMLIEIDPYWTWEPVAFTEDGLPAAFLRCSSRFSEIGRAHV